MLDLKPHNVLLDEQQGEGGSYRAVLTDFGLSRMLVNDATRVVSDAIWRLISATANVLRFVGSCWHLLCAAPSTLTATSGFQGTCIRLAVSCVLSLWCSL